MAMGAISERTIVGAKTLALGLLLVLAPLAWAADIRRSAAILADIPHSVRPAAMYGVAVVLSFAALVIAPFLRNHFVRCAFLLLFLAAFAVDRIVLATSGHHLDVTVLKLLWHNRSLAGP